MIKWLKRAAAAATLIGLAFVPAGAKALYGNYYPRLDGKTSYFRTVANYSNSTQLTVEAWVNLNAAASGSSEPGIVASSGGPDATEVNGSGEGAWMLYLKDGKYPAFRAREIEGRGKGGYLASLVAYDPLAFVKPDADSTVYSRNWTHIAATVRDNEVALYVDGELVARDVNDSVIDARMLITSHPVWIGLNPNDAIESGDYFAGGIKGVRIWHAALSQDELRKRAAGFDLPSNVTKTADFRRQLDMYYSLDSTIADLASDKTYQCGSDELEFIQKGEAADDTIPYYKDYPHVRITAPAAGAGLMNRQGKSYEIRWMAYGFGDPSRLLSRDLEFSYSMDGGLSWWPVKDKDGRDLAGVGAPDAENGSATWEPWRTSASTANLKNLQSYCDTMLLRARGTASFRQDSFSVVTGKFSVSTYTYALKKTEGSIIVLPGGNDLNLSGSTFLIEAWIKPYRFPTASEEFFPLLAKMDSTAGKAQFMLKLLSTGQLEFNLTGADGKIYTAKSDLSKPIVRPNSVSIDTAWTHVALLYNNTGDKAEARFYMDGTVQRYLSGQQIDSIKGIADGSGLPLFVGYNPKIAIKSGTQTKTYNRRGFIGEIREIRYWEGAPNGLDFSSAEPCALTKFIQGAQSAKAENFAKSSTQNLKFLLSFSEGSMAHLGCNRALRSPADTNVLARFYGDAVRFVPVKPYIKLVEPSFRQKVRNSSTNLRLRWVGMDYDEQGWDEGTYPKPAPSLEFSIRGGGGSVIQAYKYVGSKYWQGNVKSSLTFPDNDSYRFKSNSNIIYAANLDVSMADPDRNKDNLTVDQGPLSATLTNARLRLTGHFTINGKTENIEAESPLFTVTPESNFTVRALLEGRHRGLLSAGSFRDLPSSYAAGGLKLKLYADKSGKPGALLDSAESESGYESLSPADREGGDLNFANINFVFSELPDGRYWAKLENLNHLAVMSRFPAPFRFKGDDKSTRAIESGWDFTTWDGEPGNVMKDTTDDIYTGLRYTACDSAAVPGVPAYQFCRLSFNNGLDGGSAGAMASLVGGDCNHDGKIDDNDYLLVRAQAGTNDMAADITGDGIVNSDDRTIVDRNTGRGGVSALMPKAGLLKPGKEAKVQSATDLEITGELAAKDSTAYFTIYARNRGDKFIPGNCTFAFTYDTTVASYVKITATDSMAFNARADKGYGNTLSKPDHGKEAALPGLRTVEIDYDGRPAGNFGGIELGGVKTMIAKLEFKILNKNAALVFKWSDYSSIHSIDGAVKTGSAEFVPIKGMPLYSLNLTRPDGGELLRPDSAYEIRWAGNGKSAVYLNYSTNGGLDWIRISDKPVRLENLSYTWQVPRAESEDCLVSISDSASLAELDRSSAAFTIAAGFGQIISPAPGDAIYRGGSTAKLHWNAGGYRQIWFEYSVNDGATWQAATTMLKPSLGTAQWKVPYQTTKTAIMRMLDDSGNEIVRTRPFRILGGTLTFTTPKQGETIVGSILTRIRWTSGNLTDFNLLFTSDGGKTWSGIIPGINATTGYANWTPPDEDCVKAGIKAIWGSDPEMEYDRVLPFTIKKKGVSVAPAEAEGGPRVSPNPFSESISIYLPGGCAGQLSIKIYNLQGNKLIERNKFINDADAVEINTGALPAGCYIIVTDCGTWHWKNIAIKE